MRRLSRKILHPNSGRREMRMKLSIGNDNDNEEPIEC